ncbi:MAG: hypothetical protein R2737_15050 [Candidatus Nanopelagicales bacterium]
MRRPVPETCALVVCAGLVATGLASPGSPAAAYSGDALTSRAGYLTTAEMCRAIATLAPCTSALSGGWLGPYSGAADGLVYGSLSAIPRYAGGGATAAAAPRLVTSVYAYLTPGGADQGWARQRADARAQAAASASFTVVADTADRLVFAVGPDPSPSGPIVVSTELRAGGDAWVAGRCYVAQPTWSTAARISYGAECSDLVARAQVAKWTGVEPTLTPQAALSAVPPKALLASLFTAAQVRSALGRAATRVTPPRKKQTFAWLTYAPDVRSGSWTYRVVLTVAKKRISPRLSARVYQGLTGPEVDDKAAAACGMGPKATVGVKGATACARRGPLLVTVTASAKKAVPAARTLAIRQLQALKGKAVPIG